MSAFTPNSSCRTTTAEAGEVFGLAIYALNVPPCPFTVMRSIISLSYDGYVPTESPPTGTGSAEIILSESMWLLTDEGGSLFDELGCFLRKRHIGHMARLHFDRLGLGALRHHALLVRIDRSVFGGHHIPGGLVLPGGVFDLMGERVGRDRHLRYSHELSFIPWNVRCEVGHEMRLVDPPEPVAVGCERLGRLWHGRFDRGTALTFIESKRGNIDKRRNVWMIAGLGDDGPAVAVADQNHWAAHGVDCRLRVFLVVGVRSLGRLRHRHFVPIILEDLGDGFPSGAVGESSMHQNHVLDRHCCSPFCFSVLFTSISFCKPGPSI